MGSLMAGWASHVLHPKSVAKERNRSFTKEEIEAYWKSKKKADDDDDDDDHDNNSNSENGQDSKSINIDQRTKSLPLPNTNTYKQDWMKKKNKNENDAETRLEKLLMEKAWWKRSNWAFLNEPPVLENHSSMHVPKLDSSKIGPPPSHGISEAA